MSISDIHFHDSRILRVIEDTVNDTLVMEIEYPVDWSNSQFEPQCLIFSGAYNYKIFEFPFSGPPTILSATMTENGLRLDTNAGYRELGFESVQLVKSP